MPTTAVCGLIYIDIRIWVQIQLPSFYELFCHIRPQILQLLQLNSRDVTIYLILKLIYGDHSLLILTVLLECQLHILKNLHLTEHFCEAQISVGLGMGSEKLTPMSWWISGGHLTCFSRFCIKTCAQLPWCAGVPPGGGMTVLMQAGEFLARQCCLSVGGLLSLQWDDALHACFQAQIRSFCFLYMICLTLCDLCTHKYI